MSAQLMIVGPGFPDPLEELREHSGAHEFSLDHKNAVYHRLVKRAIEVFGDSETAGRWLAGPSRALQGKTPTQVAQECHFDARQIEEKLEPILSQVENGIFT